MLRHHLSCCVWESLKVILHSKQGDLNIAINAVETMPEGGTLTIRAAERLGLSGKGLQLKMIKHRLRKREE